MTDSETSSEQASETGLAQITVSSRIPQFWQEQPKLWFVQVEAIILAQKLSDEAKYNLTVTKLDKDTIQQVKDILVNPPLTNKFQTLKNRLIAAYEESEQRQIQKLLNEIDLGDQKPSQLYRRMANLACASLPVETLRVLWMGHLPPATRAVLAVSEVTDMEKLTQMADKVMESSNPQVSEVSAVTSKTDERYNNLVAEIKELSAQFKQLHRSRSRSRSRGGTRNYPRSSSRPRITPQSPNWLCYYHRRFKEKAVKCTQPCAWKPQQEN